MNNTINNNWKFYNEYNKEDWIIQLQNKDSIFYEMTKDGVEKLWENTGGFTSSILNFEGLYTLAVEDTIRQFQKNLNKKTNWLFSMCNNNQAIYQKIKSRLVNNIKNLFDSKRRTNILNTTHNLESECLKNTNIENNDSLFILEDLKKIAKKYPKKMEILLEDSGFNHNDIEDLCEKIGINFLNLDLTNKIETKKEKLKDSDIMQLLMVF